MGACFDAGNFKTFHHHNFYHVVSEIKVSVFSISYQKLGSQPETPNMWTIIILIYGDYDWCFENLRSLWLSGRRYDLDSWMQVLSDTSMQETLHSDTQTVACIILSWPQRLPLVDAITWNVIGMENQFKMAIWLHGYIQGGMSPFDDHPTIHLFLDKCFVCLCQVCDYWWNFWNGFRMDRNMFSILPTWMMNSGTKTLKL